MELEVDHLLVFCSVGAAAEAEALRRAGLREGSSRRHQGQGTENRCFYFENAYLELIWVWSEEEARSEATRPTRLWERWSARQAGASPFGVALRPGAAASPGPPFDSWPYHPLYRSGSGRPPIAMASGTGLEEPLLFYVADAPRPDHARRRPVDHAVPLRRLTGVSFGLPGPAMPSPAWRPAEGAGVAWSSAGARHSMTATFDGGVEGRELDLGPELPVTLRW